MTDVLLDTQALLWWSSDDWRLGAEARQLLMSQSLAISMALLWEIAIKVQIGRLDADVCEVVRAIGADGMARLPIRDAHSSPIRRCLVLRTTAIPSTGCLSATLRLRLTPF